MAVLQEIVSIRSKPRGFHLITNEILQNTKIVGKQSISGIVHFLLLHTSASLTLNENTDKAVLHDFEEMTNALIPENFKRFTHTFEGPDDMPAHIKSSLYGTSLTIPINEGKLLLGTWQGIYLNEHRNHGGARKIAITAIGELLN